MVGLIISVVVSFLFLIELVLFFSSFKSGKRGRLPIHFIGVIASFLVALFTITTSMGIAFENKYLTECVVVLAGIFFVTAGISSLFTENEDRVERDRKNRNT